MSWLAILLSAASLGGTPAPGDVKQPTKQQCKAAKQQSVKQHCKSTKAKPKKSPKAKVKPRQKPTTKPDGDSSAPQTTSPTHRADPDADAEPTPVPKPGATPTPTPTPGPTYPSRTGVDLVELPEWAVRPSYRTLAAGKIDFNANNLGEDDHNLSVRGGGHEYGRLDLAPGDSDTLTVTLGVGTYVLYCSLLGHEDAGMRSSISVR